jgi:WD40 repeat protein
MSEVSTQTYLYQFAFNQDCSCVSLGTTADFRTVLLSPSLAEVSRRRPTDNKENEAANYLTPAPSPVNVASMLFQTNYLALVLRSNPYKVLLWDDSLSHPPHELWSRFEVLNVLLRRDVVCVISEYKIYVYQFGGEFRVLLHLETSSNPRGLCVISAGHPTEWTLVCPGQMKGQVRVQLGLDDSISSTIQAHTGHVGAVAVNLDGTLVASASEQGTVVKVHSATDGQLLYEFRRGTTAVQISCMNFRDDSKFLVVGSASLTVHIFKLGGSQEESTTKLNQLLETATGSIPKYFQSSRAFAQFRIPDTGADLRTAGSPIVGPLCCFAKHQGNKIQVVHINGLVYEALFDPERKRGGSTDSAQECMFTGASAYFQARPDFNVGERSSPCAVASLSPTNGEDEAWNVL